MEHQSGAGGGSGHPYCHQIQTIMFTFFLIVWTADFASYFLFGYSTVLMGLIPVSAALSLAAVFFILGVFLAVKSYKPIFQEKYGYPTLIKQGVYGWIRHPMCLGGLLFLLCEPLSFIPHCVDKRICSLQPNG